MCLDKRNPLHSERIEMTEFVPFQGQLFYLKRSDAVAMLLTPKRKGGIKNLWDVLVCSPESIHYLKVTPYDLVYWLGFDEVKMGTEEHSQVTEKAVSRNGATPFGL